MSLGPVRTALMEASALGDADAMTNALAAIRTYFHEQGMTFEETRPLLVLMGALQDHQRGKPHPLLARIGNARNKPHLMDAEFQAATAATMTLIQRCPGQSKKLAAARIANRFKAEGIRVNCTTIDGWHREISSDRKPDEMGEAYRFYIERFGEPDEIKADDALRTLVSLARQKL